jgi:tetraacyldisaccharide 4'-kinase
VDAGQRQAIRARVRTLAPQAAWVETVHRPQCLLTPTGQRYPLDSLRGRTVAAFCGIGNPAGFHHTLESCGCAIAGLREFPDHHAYTVADMRALHTWAAELAGEAALVCTLKDLVRVPPEPPDAPPLWALAIDLEMQEGGDGLEERLRSLLRRADVNRPVP